MNPTHLYLKTPPKRDDSATHSIGSDDIISAVSALLQSKCPPGFIVYALKFHRLLKYDPGKLMPKFVADRLALVEGQISQIHDAQVAVLAHVADLTVSNPGLAIHTAAPSSYAGAFNSGGISSVEADGFQVTHRVCW